MTLHAKDHGRLVQKAVCSVCGEIVDRPDTVRANEHEKDVFTVLSPEEAAQSEKVQPGTITIAQFDDVATQNSLYVEKSYYLAPDKGGERAFSILLRSLRIDGLVAIGAYSAHSKTHVASLRPFNDVLLLHQLRHPTEVVPWNEVPLSHLVDVSTKELSSLRSAIRALRGEHRIDAASSLGAAVGVS